MNYKLSALSTLGLTIFSLAAIDTSALAERTSFYCDSSKSPPTTYIKSRGRRSAFIRWNLAVSRNSALQRCRIVSKRFQRQYDNNNLRFFKTGYLNGYPVVCAAKTSGDRCTNERMLFTLTRGSNPDTILAKLFNINSLAGSAVINQSGRSVIPPNSSLEPGSDRNTNRTNVEERTYNFENYVNELPNEESGSGEPTLENN